MAVFAKSTFQSAVVQVTLLNLYMRLSQEFSEQIVSGFLDASLALHQVVVRGRGRVINKVPALVS